MAWADLTPAQARELEAELDELERTDPEVRAARQRYEETVEEILRERQVAKARFPRHAAPEQP